MASASASASAGVSTAAAVTTAAPALNTTSGKATRLYETCEQISTKRVDAIFYQADLAAFGIAENNDELRELCQHLTQKHLFQVLSEGGHLCWRIRTQDEARMYVN